MPKTSLRIGVDLDGVCYDFASALRSWLRAGGDSRDLPDPTVWDFYEHQWGMTPAEFKAACDDAVDDGWVFRVGDPLPGCLDALDRLKAEGHTIHIVTARSYGSAGVADASTRRWLEDWGIPYDSLTLTDDKASVAVDVALDDNVDFYDQWAAAGVRAFLFDQPWNREGAARWRCYSWDHFVSVVDHIARGGNGFAGHPKPYDRELARLLAEEVEIERQGQLLGFSHDAGEVRHTSASGGEKGRKLARHHMIPPDLLTALAEHYGKGEAKYPGNPATGQANWQKGYPWSWSLDAHHRHLNDAWLQGEDFDEETGSHHLVAAIWHLIDLWWQQEHGTGTDDIYSRRVGRGRLDDLYIDQEELERVAEVRS